MYTTVLILHVIVSLILIAVILFQAGKGGGLADTFGGGGGGGGSQTTIFGQKASDFLTKATEVSAILFLCTSLSLAFLSSRRNKSIMENARIAPVTQRFQGNEKKVTVKKVKIDPKTGKETVVSEETHSVKEEEKNSFSGK